MGTMLELTVHPAARPAEQMGFVCHSLYNAGFAGRDQEGVRRHIRELAEMGVPAPSTTPTVFPLSDYVLSTGAHVQVQHGETSGEVEYALLFQGGEIYVTVGSDHSDRNLENYSISMAKQACPNIIAKDVWLYRDVKDHWDQLQLRCWVSRNGTRALYQDAPAGALLSPADWFPVLDGLLPDRRNLAFLSGTANTVGGLVCGDKYEIALEDPVLDRSIRHTYTVEVLRPGIE